MVKLDPKLTYKKYNIVSFDILVSFNLIFAELVQLCVQVCPTMTTSHCCLFEASGYLQIQEEEPNGFNKVKHLADDQRHLRTLIMDLKIGRETQKYNVKQSLEEALQFLDTRERFWASQQFRCLVKMPKFQLCIIKLLFFASTT